MTTFAWLFNSPMEIALLVLVAVLLFGTRKLPELGRSLGKGIVEFKKGIKGIEDDVPVYLVSVAACLTAPT